MSRVLSDNSRSPSLMDWKHGNQSVYLCLPAGRMHRHFQMFRLFINRLLNAIEADEKQPENPALMILDEMHVLGHMKSLETAAGLIAGLKVRLACSSVAARNPLRSTRSRSKNRTRRSGSWQWPTVRGLKRPRWRHGPPSFVTKAQAVDRKVRRKMIEPNLPDLSVSKQCASLSISRSSFYYTPKGETTMNLMLMRQIDEQFLETPFFGVRQMTWHLRNESHLVNEKRIRRLMRLIGVRRGIDPPDQFLNLLTADLPKAKHPLPDSTCAACVRGAKQRRGTRFTLTC